MRRAMDRPARILVVDDHPMVREGVADLLRDQADLEVCGEAEDAPSALRETERTDPDLVLVDLNLPEGTGLELIKGLNAAHPEVRILVFSMHDESIYAERSIAAGAHGYVCKDEKPETLRTAIREVLDGRIHLGSRATQRVLTTLSPTGRADAGKSLSDRLSDRELEVFQLLGEGRSTRDTAGHLNLSVKTVQTHVEHIKDKLGLDSMNAVIARAAQWLATGE